VAGRQVLVRGACKTGRFGRLAKQAGQVAEEGRTGNRTGKTHAKGGIKIRPIRSKLDASIQYKIGAAKLRWGGGARSASFCV
jgi:hypothetical protein